MKKIIWIVFLLFLFVIGYMQGQKYLRGHPITLHHPFPQLTRKFPVLKTIDGWLSATAGVYWYKVKALRTGREYFVNMVYHYEDKNSRTIFAVMDAEKRDKWIYLERYQYIKVFPSPSDGNGYAFPYDLKDDK